MSKGDALPGRTTLAAVSGTAGGVLATIAFTGGDWDSDVFGDLLSMGISLCMMVCVSVIGLAAMRRWLAARDRHSHEVLAEIARKRTELDEAATRYRAELTERERRLSMQAETTGSHVMSLATRLDEALTAHTQLTHELRELNRAYEELARDHNQLIRETLQERNDRFTRKTASARPCLSTLADNPARPYVPTPQVPAPAPAPVTPLAVRVSKPPRHDRAQEVANPG